MISEMKKAKEGDVIKNGCAKRWRVILEKSE